MGKSTPSAPAPDPQIGSAALKQAETGQQWLEFSKDAFAISQERQKELDDITKKIAGQQIEAADAQFGWAKADRARYEGTFKPIEDDFIKEASTYGSKEKQDAAAAEARGDVLTSAALQREAAAREAISLGANPNSGRFAGISRAGELGTALGAAGAANNARTTQRDKGMALKADVANLGRGLPAQSAQAAALGLNAGGSAAGLYGAANQQFIASTGVMGQGFKGAMAGYAGQADALNKQYSTQVDAWKTQVMAENQANAGIWSGLGTIAGLGFKFLSDENEKEGKEPIEDGKALEAVKSMPVEEWQYREGSGEDPSPRHIGTYAQDFQKATGAGDGRSIHVGDALGLTMKAIQDLDGKVERIAETVEAMTGKEADAPTKPEPKPDKRRRAAAQGLLVAMGTEGQSHSRASATMH